MKLGASELLKDTMKALREKQTPEKMYLIDQAFLEVAQCQLLARSSDLHRYLIRECWWTRESAKKQVADVALGTWLDFLVLIGAKTTRGKK